MSYSLSFTKSILVIIYISDKIRQEQYEFLSTAEISKYLSIPKPTLVKILQSLHASGIIETKEGKSGGIRLLKNPHDISLLEVLESVEKSKPLFQTSFNILAEGKRPSSAQKYIKESLLDAEQAMKVSLCNTTIGEILQEMSK